MRTCIGFALLCGFLVFALSGTRADDPPKAPKESKDGPILGRLHFKSRTPNFQATDVGREFDKRKYIAGHPDSPQRAIWNFDELPRWTTSASGDVVPAKLKCSLYFLLKGPPTVKVVVCVVSHTCPQVPPDKNQRGEWQWVRDDNREKGKKLRDQYQDEVTTYRTKKADPQDAKPGTDGWKTANALAEKYGYYECRLPKVADLVETSIEIPAGLFRNALKNDPELGADGKPKRPRVSVYVKCETAGVMLGVAEADLYLVEKKPAKK
jgi:hypothetical protein